jgi:hypothetical protein
VFTALTAPCALFRAHYFPKTTLLHPSYIVLGVWVELGVYRAGMKWGGDVQDMSKKPIFAGGPSECSSIPLPLFLCPPPSAPHSSPRTGEALRPFPLQLRNQDAPFRPAGGC